VTKTQTRFEWDPTKDIVNHQKHGVGFTEAQFAFADPERVIASDASHARKNLGSSALAKLVAAF
jgi:uncharacterized protein